MAKSKKPCKAYKPKWIPGALPIVFGTSEPLRQERSLEPHLCVEAFRTGKGDSLRAFTLANHINVGALLTKHYVEEKPKEIMECGLEAIRLVIERGEKGKWGCTGSELTAITQAVSLSDELQQLSKRREVRDALVQVWKEAA